MTVAHAKSVPRDRRAGRPLLWLRRRGNLRRVTYALGALGNGSDSTYHRVEYKYNRLGEVIEVKDQNETVHDYTYGPEKGASLILGAENGTSSLILGSEKAH